MIKKIFCGMLACLLVMSSAMAVPAKPGVTKTVTLNDGTTTTVYLRGDETFHFYATSDGRVVRETEDGTWVVDTRDIGQLWTAANAKRNLSRPQIAEKTRRMMAPRKAGMTNAEPVTRRGLLILVNFKDKKMVHGDESQELFDQMLNAIGQPYGKNYGSVREYFLAQSYGQFDILFDVVGPVTVSQNMAYYGGNNSNGDDKAPEKMVVEACKLVKDLVNFADYDWDGDGEVENIYITYAGYAEASGASKNTIWPHQWNLDDAGERLTLDGVKINTYACGSELYGSSGTTLDGVGTMCHEYSHCLGIPDFYDTEYNGSFGMGDWSIMDSGCNNNDGYGPAGYTAYERWFCGWLTPTVLDEPCNISDLQPIEDAPEAYVIYNDGNQNEYYLLANHQKKGWDKYAAGHGMMILHVDYSADAWNNNTVNNTKTRQRMTPIPADNVLKVQSYDGYYYSVADAGDLWPGTKKNKALTDTSTPAAKLYNNNTDGKKLMHKSIEDITEANGLISFTFMGGKPLIATPELGEPTDLFDNGFSIEWNAVEDAVGYNLQIKETIAEVEVTDASQQLLLAESFDAFKSSSETEVSSSLDRYTTVPGWSGSKVYTSEAGVKLTSSFNGGSLTTPLCQGQTGAVTLIFRCSASASGTSSLSTVSVSLMNEEGKSLKTLSKTAENGDMLFAFEEGAPENFKLVIKTNIKNGIYLSNLALYDGTFTKEQISANGESVITHSTTITKLITGLTDTHYEATDLTSGAQIEVQVQAVDAEGGVSGWSDAVSFVLPQTIVLLPGDVNGDEIVDLTDAIMIVYYSLGEEPVDFNEKVADMNGDGTIDITDAIIVVYQSLEGQQ